MSRPQFGHAAERSRGDPLSETRHKRPEKGAPGIVITKSQALDTESQDLRNGYFDRYFLENKHRKVRETLGGKPLKQEVEVSYS